MTADISSICISPDLPMRGVFELLQVSRQRICLVTDAAGVILGTITDGDCRRGLLRGCSLETPAKDFMATNFVVVEQSFTLKQIETLMRLNGIHQVPVVDENRHVLRLVTEADLENEPPIRDNVALILAGGRGERLIPLTNSVPKPMLPIKGRPMIEGLINSLVEAGIRKVFVSINYLGHKIEERLGSGQALGCEIQYLRETKPLGTAGSLRLMQGLSNLPILVANGDLLTSVAFASLLDLHSSSGHVMTIGVSQHQYKMPFGLVYTNEQGAVQRIEEKPTIGLQVNAGVYVIAPSLLQLIEPEQYLNMNDFISRLLEQGTSIGAFPIHEQWLDVGVPQQYALAQV